MTMSCLRSCPTSSRSSRPNQSGSGHDFTAPEFFKAAKITSGAAPGGEIELKPHETKTITLVPSAGTYKAHCSHFLHSQMGMTDEIVVRRQATRSLFMCSSSQRSRSPSRSCLQASKPP